ncbi:hypothetical protein ACFRAO_21015 [Streptomyces sp. NPDC056656]|uniref:hypothetical protein n=1 Tax=Streptomyces sp. NPDC056656 TaxID=3345895 RepID=UPI00369E2FED
MSSAQWLVTKQLVKDGREMVFEDGISRFRPKHSKTLKSPSKAPVRGGPNLVRSRAVGAEVVRSSVTTRMPAILEAAERVLSVNPAATMEQIAEAPGSRGRPCTGGSLHGTP